MQEIRDTAGREIFIEASLQSLGEDWESLPIEFMETNLMIIKKRKQKSHDEKVEVDQESEKRAINSGREELILLQPSRVEEIQVRRQFGW